MGAMTDVTATNDLIPLLQGVGLFSRCTDGECRQIARTATTQTVEAGQRAINIGDEGSDLFIVLEGSADAVLNGEVQRSFGAGDYFGELSALSPAPRASDVVATTDLRVAVFSRPSVYRLIDTVPGVAAKMLEGLASSLRSQIQHV
jgi:CRP-like cAMP-binding protein